MATRSVAARALTTRLLMDSSRRSAPVGACCFSDGRILSEEERAKETVYIQKMERERMEKLKKKTEKEKEQAEKEAAEKKAGQKASS